MHGIPTFGRDWRAVHLFHIILLAPLMLPAAEISGHDQPGTGDVYHRRKLSMLPNRFSRMMAATIHPTTRNDSVPVRGRPLRAGLTGPRSSRRIPRANGVPRRFRFSSWNSAWAKDPLWFPSWIPSTRVALPSGLSLHDGWLNAPHRGQKSSTSKSYRFPHSSHRTIRIFVPSPVLSCLPHAAGFPGKFPRELS